MVVRKSSPAWEDSISSGVLLAGLVLTALLLRLCVGLHPYSGMGNAPQYGDYEAQRHWMEVTVNLPVSEWYKPSADNNLSYWGLDYPPGSGYQSWIMGKVIQVLDPATVALHDSRGHETAYSKLLLRLSVVIADIIFYFPAALACAYAFAPTKSTRIYLAAFLLFSPAFIIIDHGHFQYNCISLGLAAAAMAAAKAGRIKMCSMLYCLSLNHKQMSLYYAPAFFGFVLGNILQESTFSGKVLKLFTVGVTVIATFAGCWMPFLTSKEDVLAVVGRIFPTQRGLFEDYVANFWCTSSLIFKWKRRFPNGVMLKLCTISTFISFLPSMAMQIARPSADGLVVACLNSAMSFFMLSFQVHEKSILLPLLPASILAIKNKDAAQIMVYSSIFSMYPLLKKDQLDVPYVSLVLFLMVALQVFSASRSKLQPNAATVFTIWKTAFILGAGAIHLMVAIFEPPSRYPYLFDAAITSFAFLHFALYFAYAMRQQWAEYQRQRPIHKQE